jgi:hypothetical protein
MLPVLPRCLTLGTLLLSLLAAPTHAQVLSGRVIDNASGRAVREASIALVAPGGRDLVRIRADTAGAFRLPLAGGGPYQLRADAPGYAPRTWDAVPAEPGMNLSVELRLTAETVGLEPIVISGRSVATRAAADEFYRRMQRQLILGHGHFVTRDAIESGAQGGLLELLRRQPGVDVQSVRRGSAVVALRRPTGGSCVPAIFLDGVRAGTGADFEHAASFSSASIEGVEIYRSPNETPVEMRNECGAIVIWTRRQEATGAPLSWRRMLLGGALATLMLIHFTR